MSADKLESRFQAYVLPAASGIFGIVLIIIGYFVSTEKEKNDENVKDLYFKWDAERTAKIEKLEGEVFYYRDRYYNSLENQINNNQILNSE